MSTQLKFFGLVAPVFERQQFLRRMQFELSGVKRELAAPEDNSTDSSLQYDFREYGFVL